MLSCRGNSPQRTTTSCGGSSSKEYAMRTMRTIASILLILTPVLSLAEGQFHLQEAKINDIHAAIKGGAITCEGLVQAYINRAKAYNGICTELVTKDGADIAPVLGAVRAGSPLKF